MTGTSIRPGDLNAVTLVRHRTFRDSRGALVPIELASALPFIPARLFFVHDVPAGQMRGAHAHKSCFQYLLAVTGVVEVEVSDGVETRLFSLESGDGLLIAPGLWASERYVTEDSVLLVLCDRPYEAEDYIHTLDDLRAFRNSATP